MRRAVSGAQGSRENTAARVTFAINLAVIPAPYWNYLRDTWEGPRPLPAIPTQGFHFWWNRARVTPGFPTHLLDDERWWLVTDEPSARRAADDVVSRLQTNVVPELQRLLARENLTETIRAGDLVFYKRPVAPDSLFDSRLAFLLADEGPSPELDELLARYAASTNDAQRPHALATIEWLKARADKREGNRPT